MKLTRNCVSTVNRNVKQSRNEEQITNSLLIGIYELLYGIADYLDIFYDEDEEDEK